MIRFVMYWALTGLVVPVAITIASRLQGGVFKWPELALVAWPSWILLGVTYEREFTVFGVLVLGISIAINVIVYSAVGSALWLCWLWLSRLFR